MNKTVCLNMIVKNESAVIERCLTSIRDHIDAWVIIDTGSTDDTKEKIRSLLKGIPGALHERAWKNFGHNRSEAVALAYEANCDYFLFMDADDTFVAKEKFRWPDLNHDAYEIWLTYGGYRYTRQSMVTSRLRWHWVGVLHEYPEAVPSAATVGRIEGAEVRASTEGARSSDPLKYERDAELLLQGLADEPNNTRYLFYLAQSYRDAGKLDASLAVYQRRVLAGGWDEEIWRAMLEAARLKQRLGRPFDEIERDYLQAHSFRSTRAEPLVDLARICRLAKEYEKAYRYALLASRIPLPNDRLFVEADIYDFHAHDELAVAAYWTGRYAETEALITRLLSEHRVPSAEVERLKANRQFALDKLGAEASSGHAQPSQNPSQLRRHRVSKTDDFSQWRESAKQWRTWDTVSVDYPLRPVPRPPNRALQRMIESGDGDYATLLRQFASLGNDFAAIAVDGDADAGGVDPQWRNPWFTGLDAVSLYGLIALYKPARYIEVGSGYSTKFARRAIRDHRLSTKIVSIDPQPRAEIDSICDHIIREQCENVDPEFFASIRANDIVFIDNSHRSFQNSDVTVFFNEVLPQLPPGCIYGVHDIFLPYDYPEEWWARLYNEQYLLAAYLLGGANGDSILMPSAHVCNHEALSRSLDDVWHRPSIRGLMGNADGFWRAGNSFWLKRGAIRPDTSLSKED
jgi:hypothetical protein